MRRGRKCGGGGEGRDREEEGGRPRRKKVQRNPDAPKHTPRQVQLVLSQRREGTTCTFPAQRKYKLYLRRGPRYNLYLFSNDAAGAMNPGPPKQVQVVPRGENASTSCTCEAQRKYKLYLRIRETPWASGAGGGGPSDPDQSETTKTKDQARQKHIWGGVGSGPGQLT